MHPPPPKRPTDVGWQLCSYHFVSENEAPLEMNKSTRSLCPPSAAGYSPSLTLHWTTADSAASLEA